MQPRLLLLDIETKPTTAYVWKLFRVNISIEQIVEPGGILCVGAKWLGEKETFFYSEWEHGTKGMLEGIHKLLSKADAVITYNGDNFDLTRLNGEFLLNGMTPPPPPTSIDVYKSVKRLGFVSNKLGFVGPFLKLGKKVSHEGFSLWIKVMKGDEKARERMTKYCLQDVKLLEKVYKHVRPFIKNHPHMADVKADACGACGSKRLQKRGFRRTKAFKIQRLQCQSCGAWSDGPRSKA